MLSNRFKMNGMRNEPGSLSAQAVQELEIIRDPIKDPIQINKENNSAFIEIELS
jgi:hypothetical protein